MSAAAESRVPAADSVPSRPGRQVRAFGGYQPGFDGVRGYALVCMLLYHAELGPIDGAFFALSLFFTLSGFLITSILLDDRRQAGRVDFGRFWSRRVRRLAPAAILGLLAAVVFGATVATRSQAEKLPSEVFGVVFYIVNWTFIATEQSYADLFASPSPVQHYWSLAIEEQFYLIIPLAFAALLSRNVSHRAIFSVFASLAVLSTLWTAWLSSVGTDIDRMYYGTDTRVAEVAVGIALAVAMDRRGAVFPERVKNALAVVGVVVVASMAWMWTSFTLLDAFAYRGGLLLNGVLTGILILVLIADRGPVPFVLGLKPMVWLGRMSYGIYIFHWPIFLWLTEERTGLDPWPNFALRIGVTLVVSLASFHLVETPIRKGATLGLSVRGLRMAYPIAGIALVVGAGLTANLDGDDPLATLREDGRSTRVPVATADGVLDIVVIHSAANSEIVDALEGVIADEEQIRLAGRDVFRCEGGVVEIDVGATCANWSTEWPGLIDAHDPDVVVLLVEGWDGDDLAELGADERSTAARLLGAGFDLLTANGASVVVTGSGQPYEVELLREFTPLYRSFVDLGGRSDVNVVQGSMPDPDAVSEAEYLDRSAQAIIDLGALYQRADRADATRVMVIGDSQARSLGYGLERWGANHGVWVWNAATNGCGLADDGYKYGGGEEEPIRDECLAARANLPDQVRSFDPEVVIVLSSVWDTGDRRLDGWPERRSIGDPEFDDYLTQEYIDVVDTVTETGARVVWMLAPCLDTGGANDPGAVDTGGFGDNAREVLDGEILPAVAAVYPEKVRLYDLDAVLCPGGDPLREADGISPIRADGVHFNVEGSGWFAETYGADVLELEGLDG
ncbi:MAG: acyltransferase family protein [Acidimicrobiales bacterium]